MKPKDVKWCPQHGYPLSCNKCGMPLSQPQQKEIYKAGYEEAVRFTHKQFDLNLPEIMELSKQEGRRDVVEWMKSQWPHLFHSPYMSEETWQAKLKEWGIA